MSKIELQHIDKFYGDNHVLNDINLTIRDGDFMTLLGPSGCGKTTTLRVISGLENPQRGKMLINDEIMSPLFGWQMVGDFFKVFSWIFSFALLTKEKWKVFIACEMDASQWHFHRE